MQFSEQLFIISQSFLCPTSVAIVQIEQNKTEQSKNQESTKTNSTENECSACKRNSGIATVDTMVLQISSENNGDKTVQPTLFISIT